ncbi:hypothetical protein FRC10_003909, partial [Ceratobasidium sp. 414]
MTRSALRARARLFDRNDLDLKRLLESAGSLRHRRTPLLLFSPLLQPPKATETSTAGLKEKDVAEALARHPGASVSRRAGELIAFFESGASGGSRPVSPTKSDASF